MKRIFALILTLILTLPAVLANPYNSSDISASGIGLIEFTTDVDVYEQPTFQSKKIVTLELKEVETNLTIMNAPIEAHQYFLAKTSDKSKAFLTVTDDNDEGWYEVCYLQKKNLKGWVKAEPSQFKTWRNFELFWGKKNDVYFFKDVPPEERKLYAQPFENPEDKKIVDGYNHAYKIKPVIIKGNWMLVRVLDVLNKEKIGYVRWRENDGRILMFPNL